MNRYIEKVAADGNITDKTKKRIATDAAKAGAVGAGAVGAASMLLNRGKKGALKHAAKEALAGGAGVGLGSAVAMTASEKVRAKARQKMQKKAGLTDSVISLRDSFTDEDISAAKTRLGRAAIGGGIAGGFRHAMTGSGVSEIPKTMAMAVAAAATAEIGAKILTNEYPDMDPKKARAIVEGIRGVANAAIGMPAINAMTKSYGLSGKARLLAGAGMMAFGGIKGAAGSYVSDSITDKIHEETGWRAFR